MQTWFQNEQKNVSADGQSQYELLQTTGMKPDILQHMSPSFNRSKELYMLDSGLQGLSGIELLQKRKISQTIGRMTKSSRISKMSGEYSKQQSNYLLEINKNSHKLRAKQNRKSIGQIGQHGAKEAGEDEQLEEVDDSGNDDEGERNVNLLVSNQMQRKQSASRKRTTMKQQVSQNEENANLKNGKKDVNRYQEIERVNTADIKGKFTMEKIVPILEKSTKSKNPPLTANLSIYKNQNIQTFGMVAS